MEETRKVILVIGSAVIMALLGYAIRGGFGAAMGFVLTLLIVWLFSIWKKNSS
jgi:hypothetical protein